MLAIVSSHTASEIEAVSLCGSDVITPLSNKSRPTAHHSILVFDMLNRSRKCPDMAVTDSQSAINNLADGHDRLYGPAAEQVRRQLIFKDHVALHIFGKLVAIFGGYLGLPCK